MKKIVDSFIDFINNPWQTKYLIFFFLVNFVGSIYGYYWYYGQLSRISISLWLFVPDSPLSTTLLMLVLGLRFLGVRNTLLELLAVTANIKYGLWAVFILSDFWLKIGTFKGLELMLFASHLGMAIQGWIFLRALLKEKMPSGIVVISLVSWMLANDFIDYYLRIFPNLYYPGQEKTGAFLAVALSLLVTFVFGMAYLTSGKHNYRYFR
ncbi:MAG: DUF1405 domain-containing protein [Peptococcaceae bacterium]|nr:DUF1405 domain-containing protein [Peptococcaceae bacterium]